MRIGMVSATYDASVINGVLRMVDLYRQHLEARGHEVTVFALGDHAAVDSAEHVMRSPGVPLGNYGYYAGLGYTPDAQRRLAGMDIVHCHHLFMSLEMAHRYAAAPIVYTNHTRYDLYAGRYAHLPQAAADAIMRYAWPHYTAMADQVIAPSAGVRAVMWDFGVRAPISVIENGIELGPFLAPTEPLAKRDLGIPEEAVLAAYCGRLSDEKEVGRLVEMFAAAATQQDDLHLLLIGRGPQEKDLRQAAAGYGLGDRVHFSGAVPYLDVGNYLAAADVFATASTSEVHPLTVIEAMAAGLPVVAIHSPGLTETVESGVTGLLVPAFGPLFVEALLALAGDAARRREMGAAARQASQRYDIVRTVDTTLDLYHDLLANRPDLRRKDRHGWWLRQTAVWESRLAELTQILGAAPPRDEQEGEA